MGGLRLCAFVFLDDVAIWEDSVYFLHATFQRAFYFLSNRVDVQPWYRELKCRPLIRRYRESGGIIGTIRRGCRRES
jgi:hypothetical protein